MWNIYLLERNISSTYVLFAENIKIKSPGWISSLITFIIYHLITYYGCMQANNFQGGKQIFFKRSIHNIRWSWPRLLHVGNTLDLMPLVLYNKNVYHIFCCNMFSVHFLYLLNSITKCCKIWINGSNISPRCRAWYGSLGLIAGPIWKMSCNNLLRYQISAHDAFMEPLSLAKLDFDILESAWEHEHIATKYMIKIVTYYRNLSFRQKVNEINCELVIFWWTWLS
jgi:hypothetical protein